MTIKKGNKLVFWLPRILSIIFILFLMVFSLDIFQPGLSFGQIVAGLFMHNLPALFLLIIVAISWKKYPFLAGITFILAGIIYILMVLKNTQFEWFMLSWIAIIAGPAFLIGALFLINTKNKNPN